MGGARIAVDRRPGLRATAQMGRPIPHDHATIGGNIEPQRAIGSIVSAWYDGSSYPRSLHLFGCGYWNPI